MTYELGFKKQALKEWKGLDNSIRQQLKKKLTQRLDSPHVAADAIRGFDNAYKIKLSSAGYRLVYVVDDGIVTVTVIAIGKRNRSEVYTQALLRMANDSPAQKPKI